MTRWREWVLAPAAPAAPAPDGPAVATGAPALGVVCAAPDAVGVGVALGLLAARRRRAGCALVVVWSGAGAVSAAPTRPALRPARRLAAALDARGLACAAAGRVVVVTLPQAPRDAAAAARRALAAAGAAPTVLVLGGPRDDAFAAQLAQQDLVVVVRRPGADPVLGELALAGLGRDGVDAVECCTAMTASARAVLRTGVLVPRGVARSLGAGIERVAGAGRPSPAAARRARTRGRTEHGQALLLSLGAMMAVLAGALVLAAIARGIGDRGEHQRAADLAALSAARAMRDVYPRVFAPASLGGRPNPAHLARAAYLAHGRRAALETARRNGARAVEVGFPGDALAPVRVRVTVRDPLVVAPGAELEADTSAEAELTPPGAPVAAGGGAGGYHGPLAVRHGKPMRPDVAQAFDRMARAATAAGVTLVVVSGFRGDAEQARLFAAHPDPKWVAPPGKSLHRLATELDIGPPATYGWLARHARRFGFVQRYSWEPWHFGYTHNAGTRSLGYGADGEGGRTLPAFVPERFAAPLAAAARRWSVGAALLAAQLYKESGFNPFARSPAGALGIAQFMPATARAYGLRDPFDAARAIDAQAHLMHDLLGQFGAVPLALAAYNAGPRPVRACMCVPAYPETQAYVADILGLLGGAGDAVAGAGGLEVRLVR